MSNLDSVAASYLESLNRHQMLFETMETYHPEVMQLLEACHSALQAGGKVIWFGNGGSAADAQHLAAEFLITSNTSRILFPSIVIDSIPYPIPRSDSCLHAYCSFVGVERP